MNGIHDLGGMHGIGRIVREKDEPVFHADWERRMFGLFIAGSTMKSPPFCESCPQGTK